MNSQLHNQNKPFAGATLRKESVDKPLANGFFIMDEQIEIWKDIIGYEGYYQISNTASVRRLLKDGTFRAVKNILSGGKYYCVSLSRNNNPIFFLIHRLVAIHFIPNLFNKPHINHINGIKTDNRIENLEWCTASENLKHAIRTGLVVQCKGEKCGQSKLRENDVLSIRRLYTNKENTPKELAKIYGVSVGAIWHIIYRNTWAHL